MNIRYQDKNESLPVPEQLTGITAVDVAAESVGIFSRAFEPNTFYKNIQIYK